VKKLILFSLMILCAATSLTVSVSDSAVDSQISVIKQALQRYFCYLVYWEGQEYRLGTPLPIKVTTDGEKFYAWIDDLVVAPKTQLSYFTQGKIKQTTAAVILGRGYNVALSPSMKNYAEDRDHFVSANVLKDSLSLPADCTPLYDSLMPFKERMLETVVSTMQKRLSAFAQRGIAKYPKEVTLIIADFNVDYPSTYVLVEPPDNSIYSVTLHNVQDYDSVAWEREGEYPLGGISMQSHHKPLLEKIRKHGIVRKIVLDQK
jgi:hypothetical protein